jgi:hypothetical protein
MAVKSLTLSLLLRCLFLKSRPCICFPPLSKQNCQCRHSRDWKPPKFRAHLQSKSTVDLAIVGSPISANRNGASMTNNPADQSHPRLTVARASILLRRTVRRKTASWVHTPTRYHCGEEKGVFFRSAVFFFGLFCLSALLSN